jgi:hypothetical protein
MTRGIEESLEFGVGDRMAIYPETVDEHFMRGRFFGIVLIRAYYESATADISHAGLRPPASPDQGCRWSLRIWDGPWSFGALG